MFTILLMLPFLESWITGDKREHHLLQRPRNAPNRTATMVALMTFYGILWGAGGNDILAIKFHLNLNAITYFNRVAVFVGPRAGVLDHPSLVHLAPARRPEPAAARLRDRACSCAPPRVRTPRSTCRSRSDEAYTLTARDRDVSSRCPARPTRTAWPTARSR